MGAGEKEIFLEETDLMPRETKPQRQLKKTLDRTPKANAGHRQPSQLAHLSTSRSLQVTASNDILPSDSSHPLVTDKLPVQALGLAKYFSDCEVEK